MTKKKNEQTPPALLPALILARSQTQGGVYGSCLDGGTGLQDYASIQLRPGFRIVSDDTLGLALAQAKKEGYDEALAYLRTTVGAIVDGPK